MAGKLILVGGIPASGKSFYIKNHLEDDYQKWVSKDAIREFLVKENEPYFSKETKVFNTFVQQICYFLNDDYDVYAEAPNLSRAARAKLLNRIPKDLLTGIDIIWMKTDITVALELNERRIGTRIYVQPKKIKQMMYNYSTEPEYEEGFDNIYIVEWNKEKNRKE